MDKDVIKKADFVRCSLLNEIGKSDVSGKVFVTTTFSTSDAMAAARVLTYALNRLSPCETEGKSVRNDTESRSPFHATVVGMLSTDYEERFKAEYQQTKIRYEKLKSFCNRIEASMRTCPGDTKRVQMPEHDCPLDLLRDQQRAMGEYLHCLEIRAVIEGIDL